MKRSAVALFLLLASVGVVASGQVVPAAISKHASLTVGGMASVFQPDYAGGGLTYANPYPVAESSSYPAFGVGAFVDVKLTHWVQLEAEGRWVRFNQTQFVTQDNYLVGPRVPIVHIWKANVYGKVLGGFSNMTFDNAGDHGRFTDIAFGGGADIKLTRRISVRALDVEYQYWPTWGNSTLSPYGASMGVSYRIF
jgi:hypothetical protein